MCKTPITLKNPTKSFDVSRDRLLISVPCNHCSDCNNKRRFDWQVRVYYEWLRVQEANGFCIFMTLTYNDAHLPLVQVPSGEFVSCFSKRDCQLFTKRVNKDLDKLSKDITFKYFISSEYGDTKEYISRRGKKCVGTHRPHYHCLFFFDGPIDLKTAKSILCKQWKGFGLGLVDFTSRDGVSFDERGLVDGPGAIGYTCKYVCKDLQNDSFLQSMLGLQDKDNWLVRLDRKDYRKFLPFNLQSSGLGKFLLDYGKKHFPDMIEHGRAKFPMYDSDKKTVVLQPIDLPLYLERKEFCEKPSVENNLSYRYTERGKDMLLSRMVARRQDLITKIEDICRVPENILVPEVLSKLGDMSGRYFFRPSDWVSHFRSSLGEYTIENLVDYLILFKDYVGNYKNGHYVLNFDRFVSDCYVFDDIFMYRHSDKCVHTLNVSKDPRVFKHFKSLIKPVPELEHALRFYSDLMSVISVLGESYIKEKTNYINKMSYYYRKPLRYVN